MDKRAYNFWMSLDTYRIFNENSQENPQNIMDTNYHCGSIIRNC